MAIMGLQKQASYLGLWLAIAIILLWVGSGIFLMALPLEKMSWLAIAFGIGGRSFLHTGLFILAHDAMHGNLVPNHRHLNRRIGQLAVSLYALLSYKNCQQNHRIHHLKPGQIGDPDFHDGVHPQPIFWYAKFLGGYFSLGQFLKFIGAIGLFSFSVHSWFHITYLNLFLVFLVPLILSSLQLFFFGTYLPHGLGKTGQNRHRPTNFLWHCWSLITCYHFGAYHQEHHAFPQIPWFQLPQAAAIPPIPQNLNK